MILTHYYHRNDKPFQTLSSLVDNEALNIMSNLGKRTGTVYDRFNNPQKYWRQRLETESWLRQEFVRKGGIPISLHPLYFVVGRAVWIEEGFNRQSSIIQIPLTAFNHKQISFTYSDSMISYWLKNQTEREFYHSEYHGQVFTISEIRQIIDEFGVPNQEWRTDKTRKYDIFIEAQVWDRIWEK